MSTVVYNSFIKGNAAPYISDGIGIFDSNGNMVGKIPIDGFKPTYGDRLFRFGILSDVHNNNATEQTNEDIVDFENALTFLNNKESVNMTCVCGDITHGGRPAQFAIYRDIVAAKSPNTPVYTTTGNHDVTSSDFVESDWAPYTGNSKTFEIIQNIGGINTPFLFLGMNMKSLGDTGTPYSLEDLDWLENKLEEYRNQRVFVITHLFFPDKAGNFKQIYPRTNWLGGAQLERLDDMNNRYLNSIWFSGHSHWKWYLQKYEEKANIYRSYDDNGNPTCGWCIHVPSCASPIDSNGTNTRVSKPGQSEGGIVDVYADCIVLRGMAFKDGGDTEWVNKYLPIAQYKIDTTLIDIPAKEVHEEPEDPDVASEGYVRKEHIVLNTAKANGSLDYITDLDDNYILIEFNKNNQSYWFGSPSWSTTATTATLEIEDIEYTDGIGNIVSKPDYAGFYDRTYSQKVDQYRIVDGENLVITESGSNNRAQFGTSSAYAYGTLYIKMKIKILYR